MNQLRNTKTYARSGKKRPARYKRRVNGKRLGVIILIVILIVAFIATGSFLIFSPPGQENTPPGASPTASTPAASGSSQEPTAPPTPTSVLPSDFSLAPTDKTDPAKLNFTTNIYNGDSKVDSYTRPQPINFGDASTYTDLAGVVTFRGNNYRNMSSYGTATVTDGTLTKMWEKNAASIKKDAGSGYWTGSGWTGQPLIVKWPDDVKKFMNLNDPFKTDPNFVEVIYPCEDGNIYFMDLTSGKLSRPTIHVGVTFKGTGSIYPNGIPMLFIGQGDSAKNQGTKDWQVRYRVFNLINQKQIYTFGTDDPVKYRTWQAYDSSPLISAATDTLIEPGENGVLYTIKLNTNFDKGTGELTVKPDPPVKFTYTTPDYSNNSPSSHKSKWWGWEDSCIIWRNYFICGDNAGSITCIDLNTMKLIWVGDDTDDTNSTPVLEESAQDQTAYIYCANSIEAGNYPEKCIIKKINIKNGETVWTAPYECYTNSSGSDVEGGVEGTPILGKGDISNLIIYPLSRFPGKNDGMLVALDKSTGKEVWKVPTGNYLWSSPVTFYTPEGKSYIVECDTALGENFRGSFYLIDGKSGTQLHKYTFKDYSPDQYSTEQGKENNGGAIEATPAVYNDMLVVGTRGQKIYCFKIK